MNTYTGNKKVTLVFFIAGIVMTVTSLIMGISDNLPGIILLYSGLTVILLGFVHHWRSLKKFLVLLGISFGGFILFVILHNGMYALSIMTADIAVLKQILDIIGGAFFIIAVLVCPVGVVVGLTGSAVGLLHRKHWRNT